MKPGSGTTRAVHKACLDTTPTWKDLGYDAIADLVEEVVQEALSEEEKVGGDSSLELKSSAAVNHEVARKMRTGRPSAADCRNPTPAVPFAIRRIIKIFRASR